MAHILIIEDSQPFATAQAYCLWELGHTVTFAKNGEEAVIHYRANAFDLVLLDHDLPDTNGLELFHTLRQIDPEASVVMITGRGDEQLAARMLKDGAKDYLTKSASLPQILPEVVQRVLQERETQRLLDAREAELRRAHEELEYKVARRTAELEKANQRLEQEIDYRRRVEKVLLETNKDVLAILDSVSDGFVSINRSGRITYLNRAARQWMAPESQDDPDALFVTAFPWAAGTELEAKLPQGVSCPLEIALGASQLRHPMHLRLFPLYEGVAIQFQNSLCHGQSQISEAPADAVAGSARAASQR